jgi:hypothetical protein
VNDIVLIDILHITCEEDVIMSNDSFYASEGNYVMTARTQATTCCSEYNRQAVIS